MDKNNAKCPHCGFELYVGLKKGTGFCPSCKKQFDAEKAIKLYSTLHASEEKGEKKVAKGSDYLEVERIIDRAEFYLNKKEFEKAKEELNSALEYTNTDYRVYFGLVRAETKNLTDYRNTTHKEYLEKAIECADNEEKATITRLYKDFYRLSACTDEDIELYKSEENQAIKGKIEKKLKDIIPEYMKRENSYKKYPIFFSLCYVAALALLIASIILGSEYLYLLTGMFFVGGFVLTESMLNGKNAVKNFNALLDLYDALDGFDLSVKSYRDVLDCFKECQSAFSEKTNYTNQRKSLEKMCATLYSSGSQKAVDFISTHATLFKYLPEVESDK